MNGNTRGSPPAQQGLPQLGSEFSESERQQLGQDRKRFLAYSYMTMGTPLGTTYNPQGTVAGKAAATETFQSSTETQESTVFAYRNEQGSLIPVDESRSEVGC